jgi:hypothetical protein
MAAYPSDPKTAALVRDVLAELEWLARHQDWGAFGEMVAQRYTRYFALGARLRDEDLRQFPVDLMLAAGITDPQAVGFLTVAAQFFIGMGMVGEWVTMAEQLAVAKAASGLLPDGST